MEDPKKIKRTRVIPSKTCLMCGKAFETTKNYMEFRTKHHVIPKMLDSKRNLCIWLHRACHNRLNEIYVHAQKRPKPKKLNIYLNKLNGLESKINRFHKEIVGLINKTRTEVEKERAIAEIKREGLGMTDSAGKAV